MGAPSAGQPDPNYQPYPSCLSEGGQHAPCAAEAGPTASLFCVDQSVGVIGAGQSGWTVGKCSGTKTGGKIS